MNTNTKSCGVSVQNGYVVIFHGDKSVMINPNDNETIDAAEELVWSIRNDAQECGSNYTKMQIRDLLGITA